VDGVTGSLHTLSCGVTGSLHTLSCDTLLSQQDESVREQLWSVRPRLPLKQQDIKR